MRIIGVDFTSAPSASKPITVCFGDLIGKTLWVSGFRDLTSFAAFDELLGLSGPWIAAMDFPFGQSRRLVSNLNWPLDWADYMAELDGLSREQFVALLEDYKRNRATGDKEHRRLVDERAKSISPQKLYGVPVGKMFFEGARRLWRSDCSILPLRPNQDERVVVEGYPALIARRLIGRQPYKNDSRDKQTDDQRDARRAIVERLLDSSVGGQLEAEFGFRVSLNAMLRSGGMAETLADEPQADRLDAMLCAMQAAWAWSQRERGFGMSGDPVVVQTEGWIADPSLFDGDAVSAPAAGVEQPNLFNAIPEALPIEFVEVLAQRSDVRIERIVSRGQVTPEGEWYDQAESEFVVLLSGSARLQFEGDAAERHLKPGDWLLIEPHRRHRVSFTEPDTDSVWLAVFF